MKKFAVIFIILGAGCGALPVLNLQVPIPPVPAILIPLDGQWVLTDSTGSRACLVIQESRVSILNVTCSSDPSGFVSRIIEGPVISRSGSLITLSVTYNAKSLDLTQSRLSFTGTLQVDTNFIGTRRDEVLGSKQPPRITEAVLSRQ